MTTPTLPMPTATLERWKRRSAGAAAVGLGLTLVLWFLNRPPAPGVALRVLFWSGVALAASASP
jgi:hypothetical protein